MTNGNDSIHAIVESTDGSTGRMQCVEFGLTKREYFAAMAMQGYTSAGSTGMPNAEDLASYAVQLADALINKLNK